MTEKGYQWGVKALRKRRAEIAGDLAQLQIQVRHHRRDLKRVDDILRILVPASDPANIPPRKAIKHLNIFRQGELGRLIIGVLRAHARPMTNLEITKIIFDRGGFGLEIWSPIRRRVRANLAYLESDGRAIKTGFGATARWSKAVEKLSQ